MDGRTARLIRPALILLIALAVLFGARGSVQAQPRPAPPPVATRPDRPVPPVRLLFVGASITAGVGTSEPADAFPELLTRRIESHLAVSRTRIVAHPGAVVGQALGWTLPVDQDLVVVHLATNDSRDGVPLAVYQAQLTELLARLRAGSPQAALVCLGVWGSPTSVNGAGISAQQYDDVVRSACLAQGGVYVSLSDLYDQPALHGEGERKMAAFHPNDEGAQRIAAAIYAALQQKRMLEPGGRLMRPALARST